MGNLAPEHASALLPSGPKAGKMPFLREGPRVVLLCPLSEELEFSPVSRPPVAWVRNRLRRSYEIGGMSLGLRMQTHFTTWQDHFGTNRGDIAIRIAARKLLAQAFDRAPRFVELDWDDMSRLDIGWVREQADLFVIAGGGYYRLDPSGNLSPRLLRDLQIFEKLACPIVSLCVGVNRSLSIQNNPSSSKWDISPASRSILADILEVQALSSVRDSYSKSLLDGVAPSKTVTLPDPALYLNDQCLEPEVERHDDILRVGLNLAFHEPVVSEFLLDRVRLVADAAQSLSARMPCQFFYFVHSEAERLVPRLLRMRGIRTMIVDGGPDTMLRQYRDLDLHVCQMLHSSILSLSVGVPTVCIAYDVKNLAFFELMELSPWLLSPCTTDSATLTSVMERAIWQRPELRNSIRRRKQVLRGELDAYLARVVALSPQRSTGRKALRYDCVAGPA